MKYVSVPTSINHQGQFPVVTLSFNLAPGASLGTAVDKIRAATKEIGIPASIEPDFSGNGGGIREVRGERTGADSGGDYDGLYRAGRFV